METKSGYRFLDSHPPIGEQHPQPVPFILLGVFAASLREESGSNLERQHHFVLGSPNQKW
jgi:hypothetical protein